jgi:DNA-binding NarL/FixJ family response regulator
MPPDEREGEVVRAMHQELSPREREVAALVAQGKTNAQIALETGGAMDYNATSGYFNGAGH